MWQRATHVTLLLLLIICCSPSVRLPLYLVDSELELGTDAFGATFALADILPLNPTTATSQPSPTSAASASIGTSQESARVMGLGVGLFALLIVGIIFVIITLFAAQSGYGYAAGLILAVVYAIIVGILVSVPKLGPGQVVETPPVVKFQVFALG